jgi:hypothetical protein
MDLQARVHALEILVEVLIETLPLKQRQAVAQAFAIRSEIVRSAMLPQAISESLRTDIEQHLSRLGASLNRIAAQG